jgi:hypothetical protein
MTRKEFLGVLIAVVVFFVSVVVVISTPAWYPPVSCPLPPIECVIPTN